MRSRKPIIGIYKITNQVNGKCYIGQSHNINERWVKHRSRAYQINDINYDCYFYRAIRKYGLEHFSFEILEECSSEELSKREMYYISFYDSFNPEHGYNMTMGGEGRLVQDRNRVLELWNQGCIIGDIAKIISGSRNTVKQILQEFDIDYESENKNRWIKKKSRSIEQYDEMKNLINIWSSAREAERELHIDHTAISDCCNYIRKFAGGYIWRYANRNEIARMADLLD